MKVGIWQLKSQFHWIYSIRITNFEARKSIPLEKSNGSMNFVLKVSRPQRGCPQVELSTFETAPLFMHELEVMSEKGEELAT
ncbi:hypothetical protein [Paenibacillus sp. Soil724D2]|uniref:hypothetical protein n=1 Tax=Paenibacillus sp. (strain Soil724D2) TaxID=1736392 RepID=UPI0007132F58|nr:hypothetical protein [Paenibacillus sp. Soil724D2]KRE50112.1 hypothetical protein ASG85_21955 [Paenibacillus sp. Soil724D2]